MMESHTESGIHSLALAHARNVQRAAALENNVMSMSVPPRSRPRAPRLRAHEEQPGA
jgi:hypothetical protein